MRIITINSGKLNYGNFLMISLMLMVVACVPTIVPKTVTQKVPNSYLSSSDSTNAAKLKWKDFFKDSVLVALIDTALINNQELNIILQEIKIAKNEVRARKGLYLPFISPFVGFWGDKSSQFTRTGALDANIPIVNGQSNPAFLPDYLLAANVSWQVDIWKQLRNARKSAVYRYLASVEGKNFMVTNLISHIAFAYYELMALDNQLEIIKANIEIQKNALNVITLEKAAGQVTELAVLRFQAEVSKNQSRQYLLEQKIIETQNLINFLIGKFPRQVQRNSQVFLNLDTDTIPIGIPSQLLDNRTDIRKAEQELTASKLDVKVAKANFYPMLNINGGAGLEALNPGYLVSALPQSLVFYMGGALIAPLVNRNGIKATYLSANAQQIKAAYNYERTVLKAFTEVVNQQANINNLSKSYNFKSQQVDALNRSISIAINLFKYGRADYVEVLLTQRDVLEAKMELIETKKQQLSAKVKMYQALGGGWR
ncbi:MAG: TolC family protein [Bacteroidota bacterium]|nr:TolC family protein [Bacteroidota bacterium]